MNLFNIYEPTKLNDLLGNTENKEMLFAFLNKKHVPQCYLFQGEKGCGKTLTANLMAKELNCTHIEYTNASNDRGIDKIRNIIEDSHFPTMDNGAKAYILDECHQLPTLSQEALLTTLQKPPKDTYFFFCTTEPGKMISTLKSRCKKLTFNTINSRDLYPYLIEISKKENNEISKKVARQIVETSEGHVRDAVNILESVLIYQDEEKQLKASTEKVEENETVIDLCRLLLKTDKFDNSVRKVLKDIKNVNPESIRKIVINYMLAVLLNGGPSTHRAAQVIDYLDKPIYDFAVLAKNIYSIYY